MTLIVTTVSPKLVTMVGDRRLTNSLGVVDDDAGKMGHWLCRDATMLYGYTGLARAAGFDMPTWIGETLGKVAEEADFAFLPMVSRLAGELTVLVATHPQLRHVLQKHTSVILAGYMGNGDPASVIISNFENGSGTPRAEASHQFEWVSWRGDHRSGQTSSASFLTGCYRPVRGGPLIELNELVLNGKPEKALIGKSIDLILTASKSPESGGTVGASMLAATLAPPNNHVPRIPSSRYISEHQRDKISLLDQSVTLPESPVMSVRGVEIVFKEGDISPISKQSRNSPCSCGSGRKYKKCHGR